MKLAFNAHLKRLAVAIMNAMDRAVTTGAKHDEVRDLRHPALFGLGQGNAGGRQRGQAVPILSLNRNWHLLVGFWFSAPKVRPDPVG